MATLISLDCHSQLEAAIQQQLEVCGTLSTLNDNQSKTVLHLKSHLKWNEIPALQVWKIKFHQFLDT